MFRTNKLECLFKNRSSLEPTLVDLVLGLATGLERRMKALYSDLYAQSVCDKKQIVLISVHMI